MLRSRNLRAMSQQQDELQSVSLGLFGRPASEAIPLDVSESSTEPSVQQAPEQAKPQNQVFESGTIAFFGADDYSEVSDVARHARMFANGDDGDNSVPHGSSLARDDGLSRESYPVTSSSYAIRLSIDLVTMEDSHSGVAPELQFQSPLGPQVTLQSTDESANRFAPKSWSADVFAESTSIGISADSAALVASASGGVSTLVVSSVALANVSGTFDIVIRYSGNSIYQAAFTQAAAIWAQIIIGDIPELNSSQYGLIDDLLIDASIVSIDGQGGILGQAGPDLFRTTGSRLPAHGVMQFDAADVAYMYSSGTWTGVILHEMGHILGIGTLWNYNSLLNGAKDYIGAHALAEYRAMIGDPNAASIPVEHDGGPGTAGAHWDEETFDSELMTGYVENSGSMPISRMTIGSLEDLGYVVDYGAADSYASPVPQVDDFADSLTDTLAVFGSVAVNGSSTGALEVAGDHDWFRVQLVAGVTYTIKVTGAVGAGGSLSDPYLRLHNSAGTMLAQNDDIVAGYNPDSLLTFTPTASGTYYINAGAYNDLSAGTYRVTVSTSGVVGPPEIAVSGNGINIVDNDKSPNPTDHTNFGNVDLGSAGAVRTFTVTNTGLGELTTANLVVPAGFSIVKGFSGPIAPGGFDTFQIRLDATSTGTKSGQISFTNNDSNESLFNFSITGVVAPVPVNGDDNDNVFLATANAEPFFGFGGIDTVSYANAPAVSGVNGVAVSLLAPAKNTGFAARDTFDSIENLIGSAFKDKLVGDAGNNILEGGSGGDALDGGKGIDTASYAGSMAGVVADMTNGRNNTGDAAGDSYKNIENLTGSSFDDVLTGNKLANVIQGGAGNDTLIGSAGPDTLFGQLGNDVFKFLGLKDGTDTIGDFAAGEDTIGIVKSGFKINASVAPGTGDAFDFALHYFVSGPGNAPITAQNPAGVLATAAGHGQFLFNQATDKLYWDPDGLGKKGAILIAQFSTDVDLHATDFILS